MNILDKIRSRRLTKFIATLATSGMIFSGANALAAPNADSASVFRQTYLAAVQNNKIFSQNIVILGANFYFDVHSQGQILRDDTVNVSGTLNWQTNSAPFFIEQSGDNLILSVQRGGKWNKFAMPGAGIVNAIKSTDFDTLSENLNAVKEAELFREIGDRRIFNVTLAGNYCAELIRNYERNQDTTALSADEIIAQKNFFHNLSAALDKTDIRCTWTVDVNTGETVSAAADLTSVLRAFAQNILDETADLSAANRLFMEAISNYSECHYAINFTGDKVGKPPSAARRAQVDNNIFVDFFGNIFSGQSESGN